jgi:aspartate/methionine/tyrosine aminotransferase
MNKEQEELLGEAFKNYLKDLMRDNVFKDDPNYILLSKEEFINKCKTDNEFSEKWGLKIEERELSLEERATIWNNTHNPVGNIYTHNQYDENDIPTKLITITYNDKTIESYE